MQIICPSRISGVVPLSSPSPELRFKDTPDGEIYYDFMTDQAGDGDESMEGRGGGGGKRSLLRVEAGEGTKKRGGGEREEEKEGRGNREEECRFHPPRPGRDGRS